MRALVLSLTVMLMAAGCNPDNRPASDTKVYRHAMDGVPGNLDPVQAGNIYADTLVVALHDTLYRYRYLARPYELTSNLAADLPEVSDDGLVYTIRLREGARFMDHPVFENGRGREVTATDVIYSLKRHFDPASRSRGAWLWRGRIEGLDEWGSAGADHDRSVPGLTAVDRHTVRIRLTEPYPQLTHTLANALSAIVAREAVEHHGREYGMNPVGSGPFQLQSINETRAVLVPNPNFDRGRFNLAEEGYDPKTQQAYGLETLDGRPFPFVDRLEVHFITEPAARWSSFASGREVHNVMVPNEQARRMISGHDPIELEPEIRDRFHYLIEPEAGFVYYGFNMDNPDIGHHPDPQRDQANHALRCAIRDAYDWQARNQSFHFGMGKIFPGVIPPILDDFDPDLDDTSIRHDPERARNRVLEAGWTPENLPELRFGLESSIHQRQMFEQFRAKMAEAGLPESMFRPRSFATFADLSRAVSNRQLDIFMMSWTLTYPDAQYNLQLFYSPNASPGANRFNYRNEQFDRQFEQASILPPGRHRSELYQKMNRIVIDDCVIISGLSRTRLHLWRQNVVMLPDREMLGGFFLQFVDVVPATNGP